MVDARLPAGLEPAYAACLQIARGHVENFPVASRLLPPRLRPHLAAIYAFARLADDIADEPGPGAPERLALLDDFGRRLHGEREWTALVPADRPRAEAVFLALDHTRRVFDLPVDWFDDLLSAFRQDVTRTSYETWAQVLDYCRRSANPVGRLVLRLFGYRQRELDAPSDALCTALQLTNFWQDLAIDWRRGRLYVPAEQWRAAGADPAELDRGALSPAWVAALGAAAARTRRLYQEGRPVCDGVAGRLRYELRATWLGGHRVLDRLERIAFDTFTRRPSLGRSDAVVIAWRALTWRATPRSTTPS